MRSHEWALEVLIAHWDGYSGDINNFYQFVGFVEEGAVHFDKAGATESNLWRGNLDAQMFTLPPALAEVFSRP